MFLSKVASLGVLPWNVQNGIKAEGCALPSSPTRWAGWWLASIAATVQGQTFDNFTQNYWDWLMLLKTLNQLFWPVTLAVCKFQTIALLTVYSESDVDINLLSVHLEDSWPSDQSSCSFLGHTCWDFLCFAKISFNQPGHIGRYALNQWIPSVQQGGKLMCAGQPSHDRTQIKTKSFLQGPI